jgi:hypothetical protein
MQNEYWQINLSIRVWEFMRRKFPSKKSPKSAKKLTKGIAIWILLCYNIPAVRSDA